MGFQYLKTEVSDRTAVVTVDFPPANSLAPEVRAELDRAVGELAERDDVWCLIITAAGEKFFMAGANIPSLLSLEPEEALVRVRAAREFFEKLRRLDKPVIAAVNGLCLGGGLEMAMACDIRIAADHVKLGLPETGLGLMPGGGGTVRLPGLVGSGLARHLIFTGRTLTAAEALAAGLVQETVPIGELREAARALARRINRQGPLGVRAAKRAVNAAEELPLSQAWDLENRLWAELCGTGDKNEGVQAFLAKRRPAFKAC